MRAFIVAIALFIAGPAAAQQAVDLELLLAADGSGSIDDAELAFQRDGYARAITSPLVLDAILSGYNRRIAIAYVEWGGADSQEIIVDWTLVDGPETAAKFANALRSRPRAAWGWNSISNAIAFGQRMIETNDFEGFRKIIDVSADAGQFGGMPLPLARAEALAAGITINGLAILRAGSGRPGLGGASLETFFEYQVIGGFGAFVITADSETSFAEAVRNKLLLEIAAGPHNTPTGQQQAARAD